MMNIPKLFEGAMLAVFRLARYELPRVRTWRNLSKDPEWTATSDRVYPLIDIRCSPPVLSKDDGVTLVCPVNILIATNTSDDPSHETITRLEEDIQGLLDALYSQFRSGTPGAERNAFDQYLSNNVVAGDPTISVGGFVHGDPLAPFEDSGANYIGFVWEIHFSRSDY